MTPIEKNIRVVDEQGNEYEATYPKRAKGLVKNGRARFVDEHTICLACPPNQLEEKMTENIVHTEQEELTTRDIFEKIAQLQKQMAESSFHSLHRLGEAISSISEDEENEHKADHVDQICKVFIQRELTWQKMLALYEKMYDDAIAYEKECRKWKNRKGNVR